MILVWWVSDDTIGYYSVYRDSGKNIWSDRQIHDFHEGSSLSSRTEILSILTQYDRFINTTSWRWLSITFLAEVSGLDIAPEALLALLEERLRTGETGKGAPINYV